jgi:hypothetical protein
MFEREIGISQCEFINSCFFFNEQLFDMPLPKEYFIQRHCQDAFNKCAHYQLSDYFPYFK